VPLGAISPDVPAPLDLLDPRTPLDLLDRADALAEPASPDAGPADLSFVAGSPPFNRSRNGMSGFTNCHSPRPAFFLVSCGGTRLNGTDISAAAPITNKTCTSFLKRRIATLRPIGIGEQRD
jgi:hypothetical protein